MQRSEIHDYLIELGFNGPYGCNCPGKPIKYKKDEDYILKIYYKKDKWELWKTNCVRYGKIESIIEEINDYFSHVNSEN